MEINSIIISTVDRKPEYIHQTLASLAFSLGQRRNIHLMVDGESYNHCLMYSSYCKIYLNKVEAYCDTGLKRAAVNYCRCLMLAEKLGGFNLILEDDVLFHPDWVSILNKVEIPRDDWLLTLHAQQNKDVISEKGYEEFVVKKNTDPNLPQEVWCKTFATIYAPKILNGLPQTMIKAFFLQKEMRPYDVVLGSMFLTMNIPIYECVPNLVKHLGKNSRMEEGKINNY